MRTVSRAKALRIREQRQADQRRAQRWKLMALVATVAAFAVVALVVAGNMLREDDIPTRYASQMQGRTLGSPTAPVLIEAWEDYQCPICKAANTTVLEQIDQKYVATGIARVEFRNYPFLGPESLAAAEAAECAAEQGKFWPFHDAIFNAQRAENSGALGVSKLKGIAVEQQLDTAAFNTCVDSARYRDSIGAEKNAGTQLGVAGTPTFFVNGQRISDWRDFDAFAAAIEKAAKIS